MYKKWKPELNDDDIANIPFKCPKVPQQKDGTQCGYYVLYYMYRFLMDSPIWFNIHKDYPGFVSDHFHSLCCFNLLQLIITYYKMSRA